MAKKKAAKKAKAPKAAKRKAAKVLSMPAGKGRAAKAVKAARKPGPRSQVLPGMEQVRNAKLDRICEDIAEGRAALNRLAAEDDQNVQGALEVMTRDKVMSYRHAGVELALALGVTKLRVRVAKDKSESGGVAEPINDVGVTADEAAAEELGDINEGADEGPTDFDDLDEAAEA